MLKKLIAMLVASAFAFTAFAQAPKSDTAPKAPGGHRGEEGQQRQEVQVQEREEVQVVQGQGSKAKSDHGQ